MLLSLSLFAAFSLASAQRFVRFIGTDGAEHYGDAILPDGSFDALNSTQAREIKGDILGEFNITNNVLDIQQILSPLPPEATRSVRCVGFNYFAHDNETSQPIPQFPILFFKPWTALSTPFAPIHVTPFYQNQTNFTSEMDYEAELVVFINKDGTNIPEDQALDHVLGFSVGNDVSHRGWQIDRGGEPQPQFSMGKDADTWAPYSASIVSTNVIPDPQTLHIWTTVNGELKQNDTTANMVFGVKQLVSFFSSGITLKKGDIIFTGTPGGTNLGKTDPVWLQDGDVVTVGIDGVGTSTNTITYVDGDPQL